MLVLHQSQTLYDIAINQFTEGTVSDMLNHALVLYHDKLACNFVAVVINNRVIRQFPGSSEIQINELELASMLFQENGESSKSLIEFFDNENFYYAFKLSGFGRLIMASALPMETELLEGLKKLTHQLGIILKRATDENHSLYMRTNLTKSEAYLRAILENTQQSVWAIDEKYCLTYINDVFKEAFCQTFQHKLEVGMNLLQVLPESLRSNWKSRYDRVLNGETIMLTDCVEINDSLIHIEVSGNPITIADSIVGASFIGTDISVRKQIEEARKELIDRFEQIGASVPGLIYQYRIRPDGTSHFPYVSNSIEKIFGLKPNEVLETAEPAFRLIFKKDLAKVQESIKNSALMLKPWAHDFRIKLKGAKIIWVQGNAIPQVQKDGSIIWTGYFNDISTKKEAEMELLKLSRAIEQNPASVIITNRKGVIEYVNPKFSEVTGYSFEEAKGEKPNILKSGLQSIQTYKKLWTTIKNKKTWRGELHNKKKNGDLFWERASISAVVDSEGKITNFLAVKEDITERKQAEEEIRRNLQEKSILLAEVHHRVKNNMAIMYSLLGLQTEFSTFSNETTSVIKELQSRIRSMGIVHELVYQNDVFSEISLKSIVEKISLHLESIYKPTDSDIHTVVHVDDIPLNLNLTVPFSLLINEILTNKWKHSFEGRTSGLIEIKITKVNKSLELIIQDDGLPVPDLMKLRNPESYGYTIIHGLVSQLDGSIAFTNIESGGLKIEVSFPTDSND